VQFNLDPSVLAPSDGTMTPPSGLLAPKLSASMRARSTPWRTSHLCAARARAQDRRLFTRSGPRSSVCPLRRTRNSGRAIIRVRRFSRLIGRSGENRSVSPEQQVGHSLWERDHGLDRRRDLLRDRDRRRRKDNRGRGRHHGHDWRRQSRRRPRLAGEGAGNTTASNTTNRPSR